LDLTKTEAAPFDPLTPTTLYSRADHQVNRITHCRYMAIHTYITYITYMYVMYGSRTKGHTDKRPQTEGHRTKGHRTKGHTDKRPQTKGHSYPVTRLFPCP